MDDINDSKLWVTMVVNIAAAVVAILSVRGLLTAEEGALWVHLVEAIATPVALLVMAWVTKTYTQSKTQLQIARLQAGLRD